MVNVVFKNQMVIRCFVIFRQLLMLHCKIVFELAVLLLQLLLDLRVNGARLLVSIACLFNGRVFQLE